MKELKNIYGRHDKIWDRNKRSTFLYFSFWPYNYGLI